jgi:hypothetical protein
MTRAQLAAIVDAELLNRSRRPLAECAARIMAAADAYRAAGDPVTELHRRELLDELRRARERT